jgi:hypothetical protein
MCAFDIGVIPDKKYWTIRTLATSIERNDLKSTKHLLINECPRDKMNGMRAAKIGSIEMIQLLKKNGVFPDKYSYLSAAKHNQIACIEHLKRTRCPFESWIFFDMKLYSKQCRAVIEELKKRKKRDTEERLIERSMFPQK